MLARPFRVEVRALVLAVVVDRAVRDRPDPQGAAPPAVQDLPDALTSRTIALTEIARDHGLIRAVDPEISALAVLGAIDAILFAQLRKRRAPRAPIPQITAELVDIVLRGIRG